MSTVKVTVKWGKETFTNVEVDLSASPLVFKAQIFALTGVPPDRQKIVIKGSILKDDSWGKIIPKNGMSIMLMGSAIADQAFEPAPAPPVEEPKFVEDMPEEEQEFVDTRKYGSGLVNTFNTCYMNATLQCLYAVPNLREALLKFQEEATKQGSGSTGSLGLVPTAQLDKSLITAAGQLFSQMSAGPPVEPRQFLAALQRRHPEYARRAPGLMGAPLQHDAEEFLGNFFAAARAAAGQKDGASAAEPDAVIDPIFRLQTRLSLKCEETGELTEEVGSSYLLKCNINEKTTTLLDGMKLALAEEREKPAADGAAAGAPRVFRGSSWLLADQLPPMLTVQMMRFYFSKQLSKFAKILRKVPFPLELDVFDLCAEDTRAHLAAGREALRLQRQAKEEARKRRRQDADVKKEGEKDKEPRTSGGGAAAAAPGAENEEEAKVKVPESPVDVEMKEAPPAAATVKAPTGLYELSAVVTHQGRLLDSGHYVAWVRQQDKGWLCFNDEKLSLHADDEVLALSGGGDWHMAYLLFFRAVTVDIPAPAEEKAKAAAEAV